MLVIFHWIITGRSNRRGEKLKKIIKRTLGARIVKIKVRINLIASNSRIYIDFDSRKDNKTPKKFQQPKEQFYHLIIIQGERMTIKQGGSVLLREEKVYTSQSRPIFISFRKNWFLIIDTELFSFNIYRMKNTFCIESNQKFYLFLDDP